MIALVPAALAGACASSSLSPLPPGQGASGAPAPSPGSLAGLETTLIVSATPTATYAHVARGILGCWFGADGPLKATHVFHAEAQPPAEGGAAEIVVHERDVSLRDQRGVRAYRIGIAKEPAGARLVAAALKMEPRLARVMAKDVEVWAKGGTGCQLRSQFPAPPAAKTDAHAGGKKQRRQPSGSARRNR
jgi:hypothetical protein